MTDTNISSSHTFHIPVMGTGFTIDTPLRVAKYGISSVISLVDDTLIEQMRKYHCEKSGQPYENIPDSNIDARALRITAYLNLLDKLIKPQVEALQASEFIAGSEITRYFELLPDCPLKQSYLDMLSTPDAQEKKLKQDALRKLAVPGTTDVNIMAKLAHDKYINGEKQDPKYSDETAALRGYANSTLSSSLVISAGMNPRLFSYMSSFDDFFPDENGNIKKKLVLKVSDFRSAMIQGKFLAKRGIWVSEYRIESGLNCGGHAFATQGYLMGPILEEFKQNRHQLSEKLRPVYDKALNSAGKIVPEKAMPFDVTVQGGIGTNAEHEFLLGHYNVSSAGWCTPFMLVPEATNVDKLHLEKLASATENELSLDYNSPLGILYWNLLTSTSEQARKQRIEDGKPGTACPKQHACINTEFTKLPICTSSKAYQKLKLQELETKGLSPEKLKAAREDVLAKACICHELGGSVKILNDIEPDAVATVCCGPGIVDFNKVATLEEMADHIYGRKSLLANPDRPHMFVKELKLYIEDLNREIQRYKMDLSFRTASYFTKAKENLLEGIDYYRELADEFTSEIRSKFLSHISELQANLVSIAVPEA